MCIKALRVVAYFYGVMAVQRAVHAMLQGSGAMLPIMIISVFAIVIRVPLSHLLAVKGNNPFGLMWAQGIAITVVSVLSVIYARFGNWRRFVSVRRS